MSLEVLPGCEPFSFDGGSTGVLVVHGFTSSPLSVRDWGSALAARGFCVAGPRLPGHGTTWRDLATRRWRDWVDEVERGLDLLAGRCGRVFVAAQSFGGALALHLASTRQEQVAGAVLVNPWVRDRRILIAPAARFVLQSVSGTGNDIKKVARDERAYARIPVRAIAEVTRFHRIVRRGLPGVRCPLLLFRSAQDHVVPDSSAYVAARVSSTDTEIVTLEDSYHVATMDNDAETIFERSADFIDRVAGG